MRDTRYDFFVQWHLTERCNLACRHCYQQDMSGELELTEIYRAIDQVKNTLDGWAADYGLAISPAMHFTGGEPLLRKDLFTILDYAGSSGFTTVLLTNGTLITPEVSRRLEESRVEGVQVSLDGMESTHDNIRGHGSFRRAVTGIEILVSAGISTHINLTLSRLNAGELEALARFAGDLGVDRVTYSRLVACGSGTGLSDQMLTPEELASLHSRLRKRGGGEVTISSRDPLALVAEMGEDTPDSDFPLGGCAAGIFGITIASDGCIMPCRRMGLVIGNIQTDSLRQLWIESPVLARLRDRSAYHGGCAACRYWAVCRGCRAVALAASRSAGEEDYLGPDPQCPLLTPGLGHPGGEVGLPVADDLGRHGAGV